ncbi:apolipoprotein A1/A4/E family protein, partial [Pseudomonas sp. MN1F]|uniref:apolipoprotein A1/A4/E family protein n=1 Tax=Pseudomonas sp. MN1F TaxID=1366632 RepID=UPI001C49BBCF
GIAYSKTIAACLAGGITEAPSTNPEPAQGSSEALWLKWLQDPNSPPYRALLLRDGPLMAALLPSFSPTEPTNWNDSEKLYSALSKFITSEDAGLKMRDSLKQAITELQSAVNAASLRLQVRLDPGVQQAVRHLNSASQRIYNGVHLIELQVQMKLGEYYALQSAHLRELQNSASQKLAEARAQMMPDLEDVKAGIFRQAGNVKPIIQTGLLSLAVLDPKVAHQIIPVSVWVEGTAHELHERLAREVKLNVNQLNNAAKMALVNITVAAGTLELDARKTLNGMKISAGQASQLVRDSFSGLRGTGKGWELLLSLGGLFLMSDSLEKNLKIVEEEIGPKSNEAMMALYGSSLGLLGGEIELLGLLMPHRAKIENRFSIGRTVASTGAAISAITGLFDTIQALLAMRRSSTSGDETSYEWYRYTFIAGILSTVFSTAAVFYPIMFGPLGIAVVLGFVTYTLMKTATESESTPLERWARRCYFGNANESPRIHWDSPNYADIAISELNACTLGLTNGLTFVTVKAEHATSPKIGGLANVETNTTLKFRIMLPQFTEGTSGYHWALIIHRSGDGNPPDHTGGEVIASEQYFVPSLTTRTANHTSLAASKRPRAPDYRDTIKITNTNQKLPQPQNNYNLKVITGTVELTPDIGRHNILSATLVSAYWPDRNIPDAVAEVKIQAEKQ